MKTVFVPASPVLETMKLKQMIYTCSKHNRQFTSAPCRHRKPATRNAATFPTRK